MSLKLDRRLIKPAQSKSQSHLNLAPPYPFDAPHLSAPPPAASSAAQTAARLHAPVPPPLPRPPPPTRSPLPPLLYRPLPAPAHASYSIAVTLTVTDSMHQHLQPPLPALASPAAHPCLFLRRRHEPTSPLLKQLTSEPPPPSQPTCNA